MIITKDISLFKKSLENITPLIQETNVRFRDEGIYIKAVDKSQILLVDFFISNKAFDSYDVEPNLVGLNILELQNIISRSFEKDKLSLNLKDHAIDIILDGSIERKFMISYLDLPNAEINLPSYDYEVSFSLNAGLLKEILKDVTLIGTTLTFKIKDNKLFVEAIGEKGQINTFIPALKLKSNKDFVAKFSLSFLRNITKSMDNDADLLIKLGEEIPLYLEYSLNKDSFIKYYLSSMLI